MSPAHYRVFETPRGHSGIAWNEAGITRLTLPAPDRESVRGALLRRLPASDAANPPAAVASVIRDIEKYFQGERIDFRAIPLDLRGQSELFTRIYAAARAIDWGRTTTYGAIARSIDAGPEAARSVGQAMARNPVPLIIPCHRVLAAGGKLGGFSAPGGLASKRHMLALEGVGLTPPAEPQQTMEF